MPVTLLLHQYNVLNCKILQNYLYDNIKPLATKHLVNKVKVHLAKNLGFDSNSINKSIKYITSFIKSNQQIETIINIRYLSHIVNILQSQQTITSLESVSQTSKGSFNINLLKIDAPVLMLYQHYKVFQQTKPWGQLSTALAILWDLTLELFYIETKEINVLSQLTNIIAQQPAITLHDYLQSAVSHLQTVDLNVRHFKLKNLNKRQLKALKFILKKGKITRKQYTQLGKVSFMTAYRDLQDLVKRGFITPTGHSSITSYIPSSSFKSLIAKASLR